MEYFRFEINKPRSVYIATDIRIDAGKFCVSYEKIACMGHREELTDFQFRMEQIVEKRKCLKMFWSLGDVLITICLLALIGFALWLKLIPKMGAVDSDMMLAFAIVIALNILFFLMRFTQTIELTLADGSVRLIPIGAFLLGPVNHSAQDRIARFCKKISLDM